MGLQVMKDKYLDGEFGVWPRVKWSKTPVLPTGLTDKLGENRIKIYCPKCQDVYSVSDSNLDGAYIGVGFPFAVLTAYPELNTTS